MSLYQAAVDLIAAQSEVLELEDQLAAARQKQYTAESNFAKAQSSDDALVFQVEAFGLSWMIHVDEETREPVKVESVQIINEPRNYLG